MSGLPPRRSIGWYDGRIRFIDQTLLPGKLKIIETDDWTVIADAIRRLAIRGAPLIGVAAALAVAASAVKASSSVHLSVQEVIEGLSRTRPTASNLFWALKRMQRIVDDPKDDNDLADALVEEALNILEDDRLRCRAIGENAQVLIGNNARILTVCNAGFLATAGGGTALACVYHAFDAGKKVQLFAPETRPLLQGARLTVWEMTQAGIPVTLMVDSAVAGTVATGKIDICIIGADRIASNGDTANKVGSYQIALACKAHNVPLYVAAPWSTIDADCPDGSFIPIEQRSAEEVVYIAGQWIMTELDQGMDVLNPAFDIVPAELISGIITENDIYRFPYYFS